MLDMREGNCPHCRHNEVVQSAPMLFAHQSPPLGVINLFTCRRCGFSQLFAYGADKIPIGDKFGTRLLKGRADSGPYR
jgi:hypothetical protein